MPWRRRRSDTRSNCGLVRPQAEAKSPSAVPFRTAQEHLDRIPTQLRLGKEADGRTRGNQLGELLLGMSRDENHGVGEPAVLSRAQATSDGQAVVSPEVDVNERKMGAQLRSQSDRLLTVGRHAQDVDPILLQELQGNLSESRAV